MLDATTLAPLPGYAATDGIDNGDLSKIAWSRDGRTLYAAGRYADSRGRPPILRWADGGRGTCAAPTATCIRYGGGQIADFRGREMDLHVDPAGTCVGFGTASSRMRCLKGLKNPICTKTGG